MIDWRDPDSKTVRHPTAWSASRWGFAVVTVASVYGAALWLAVDWRPTHAADGGAPPAVMIDLAPLEAPPAPPQETPPGPRMVESEPVPEIPREPDPEPLLEPAPPPELQPEPENLPAPPPEPQVAEEPPPQPEPEIKIPEPPKIEQRDAVVLPAAPTQPKIVQKPPPRAKPEPRKPTPPQRVRAPQTSAPLAAERQASRATAPNTGASVASSAATASWRSSMVSHLNRYKRYPAGATRTGVASVSFTIDRSGNVTGSRLVSSTGDASLDAEALSLPRRASPLPAPPQGFGVGRTITLTVPIRFNR
ncbi:MAG: energy transducer TonB [Beijerinckiaceae bacterium]|nr:energy transducer TonB [Beijerinckiaceae bacterium]